MYQLFELENCKEKIMGYSFDCQNPEYVVCLIHGIGEYAGRYDRMASYFSKENIAMVSMDLRGHGKSVGPLGHCAPRVDVLDDIDMLLEYAQKKYPNIPIVLYGHSMGGNITLDYRARGNKNDLPIGYIISAPWIRLCRPVTGALFNIVKIMSKLAPKMTISSECKEEDLGCLEFVKPYKENPMVHSKISMLCAYEGFTIGEALENGTHFNNGRANDIPCLLMHGDSDKICSVEGSRNFVKIDKSEKLQYIEWPGYYHEIHNGGPNGQTGEEVIKTAISFIKGLVK